MRSSFPSVAFLLLSLAVATPAAARDQARNSPEEAPPKPAAPAARRQEKAPESNPYLERFRQLDSDGDGYVSPAEWPLDPERFATVDRNKDGRLSRGELLTPNTLRRRDRRFQELDTSGDGRLSPRERQRGGRGGRALERLDRLDRNGDGYVSRGEYAAQDPENTWGTHATPRAQSRFRDLDRNSDNRLGPLEFTGPAARFHHLDWNRDGFISPSEWTRR